MSDDHAVLEAALEVQQRGERAALALVVRTQGSVPRQAGSKMLIWPDGRIVGTIGGGQMEALVIAEAQESLQDGQTRMLRYDLADLESGDPGICGGTIEIYVEPMLQTPTILVIGCGHVGQAVAELSKWMGYRVIAADDRPGYATPEAVPGMDEYVEAPISALTERVAINSSTYVAAVTRGLPVDKELLPALLATEAPYIGLIGSRRRWAITVKELEDAGVSRADLARIHAPIGLALGGETPKEIALSILSEIVMVMHGGTSQSLQWMGSPEAATQEAD